MKRRKSHSATKERCTVNILSDPMKRDDLVVNKNRLSEISDWLDRSIVSQKLMMLLNGPAGCGKTACVRVLASEKGMQVFEWSNPIDSLQNWDEIDFIKPIKASSKFRDFLFGVGRYSSVVSDEHIYGNKKLIIIKDFPSSFFKNPEEFREIISEYAVRGCVPVVFICTESPSKKSKDIAYELFTEDFKARLGISQLSFLPVPVTSVVKALKRIVQQTGMFVRDEVVRELAQESRGDIRKALNDLIISSAAPTAAEKFKPLQKKPKKGEKPNSSRETDSESTGLFHTVGRILYAKKIQEEGKDSKLSDVSGSSVSKLIHKPLDIVKQFSHYANQVVSLTHTNYLDIFSSIDCIARAAEYLSDADLIMSEWREKDVLTSIGFSVAVAGLMVSNTDPVQRFRPIRGSKWNEDLKMAEENHVKMHSLFSGSCSSRENICLEVIPFLKCIWNTKRKNTLSIKQCQHGFLPHEPNAMFSALSSIKEDVFLPAPFVHSLSNNEDSQIHISDDSD